MPPVFGPRSPSNDALVVLRGGERHGARRRRTRRGSSPPRRASTLLEDDGGAGVAELALAHRCGRWPRRPRRPCPATTTPLPAASPSALTTRGAPAARTWRSAASASSKTANGGGRDAVALAEALHEGLGALEARGGPRGAEGADASRLRARRPGPSVSGSSGPTTTRSARSSTASSTRPSTSSLRTGSVASDGRRAGVAGRGR